ncbi:MAG: NAD-dependent epimerase, partial [Bacteroidota bacterium]
IEAFFDAPRMGEVYNIGGGRENSTSILEAFKHIENISGKPMNYKYSDQNRIGDHICYISDLSKMKAHYPEWGITKSLQTVFEEIAESWEKRLLAS